MTTVERERLPARRGGGWSRDQGRPEQQIHRAVVQHLRQRATPGVVFIHVPNGGQRRLIEAAIFKALGVRAGVSDLLLWHDRKSFALELKAEGGRATEAQKQFLADMERAGSCIPTAPNIDSLRDSQIRESLTRCWLLKEEQHRWVQRLRSDGLISRQTVSGRLRAGRRTGV